MRPVNALSMPIFFEGEGVGGHQKAVAPQAPTLPKTTSEMMLDIFDLYVLPIIVSADKHWLKLAMKKPTLFLPIPSEPAPPLKIQDNLENYMFPDCLQNEKKKSDEKVTKLNAIVHILRSSLALFAPSISKSCEYLIWRIKRGALAPLLGGKVPTTSQTYLK